MVLLFLQICFKYFLNFSTLICNQHWPLHSHIGCPIWSFGQILTCLDYKINLLLLIWLLTASPIVYRLLKAMTTSLSLLLCLYLSVNKIYQNILGAVPYWRKWGHTRENAREIHLSEDKWASAESCINWGIAVKRNYKEVKLGFIFFNSFCHPKVLVFFAHN